MVDESYSVDNNGSVNMPTDEAIAEGANAINTLTVSAPALGALAIVIIIFGAILILMQRAQNQMQRTQNEFIGKMQKQQEEQLDKTIDFVSNYAAMEQSDRDTISHNTKTLMDMNRTLMELNRDCRLRFGKDGDDIG